MRHRRSEVEIQKKEIRLRPIDFVLLINEQAVPLSEPDGMGLG